MTATLDTTTPDVGLAKRMQTETIILDLRISKPGFRAKARPGDFIKTGDEVDPLHAHDQ